MSVDPAKKKTFVICGRAQSGNTSLAEAILFKCGSTSRLGSVDTGTAVSDYEDDEKERKSSINLSVLAAQYKGTALQFIDTPGYLDFIGEVVCSGRAADFAVMVVDAVEGVGIGTEKAWEIIQREKLPCLFFINKLDTENADYLKIVEDIRQSLTKKAASIAIIQGKALSSIFKDKNKNAAMYNQVVEAVAESDDALCEKYLETGSLSDAEGKAAP